MSNGPLYVLDAPPLTVYVVVAMPDPASAAVGVTVAAARRYPFGPGRADVTRWSSVGSTTSTLTVTVASSDGLPALS